MSNFEGLKLGEFAFRHIGPSAEEIKEMLSFLGYQSLDSFITAAVSSRIATKNELKLKAFPEPLSERAALNRLKISMTKNRVFKSYIGTGYYDCLTPTVIQRNILENPGWYTQYTPYQAEIAQGRLEALLNFQTVITELTGLAIANASLLDEATAAAEAMSMCLAVSSKSGTTANQFLVARDAHPQTIALLQTRAEALGVDLVVTEPANFVFLDSTFGAFIQYPTSFGEVNDYRDLIKNAHLNKALVVVASDLLALTLLESPGALGADVVVGSAQRFGVPLGFGGPHAAFFATRDEFKRSMPGRIVGVSKDSSGNPALRLALQTREQHIRRDKATSNICTAQVLLAVMAGMYAVYHGPKGLKAIAERVHSLTEKFVAGLKASGIEVKNKSYFDTVVIETNSEIIKKAYEQGINLRVISDSQLGVSFDETKTEADLVQLLALFGAKLAAEKHEAIPKNLERKTDFLKQKVFNAHHSETKFLRYCRSLEAKDLSLCHSMIPLGSCTMKLNSTSEMLPVTWSECGGIHPFAPREQYPGYLELFNDLEKSLAEITGFAATSLQPNAGSQGEYAGLLVIRAYHKSRGDTKRNLCLIPKSAHGTNPASAVMAGFTTVQIACDSDGNIDLEDLRSKANQHPEQVACLMVTYPSTHGVFEDSIKDITQIIHEIGGQVYLDGANLNALVGLVKPEEIGADVCHINLHKTFCIPHGGGGPGMGPICVAKHLVPFLPNHPNAELNHEPGIGPVSAAPWGSASILPISWMYIAMMGSDGLTLATKIAILNANYVSKRLAGSFETLFKGKNGLVAHECVLDLRAFKESAGIEVDDVAKRLIDYGFHAPTVSWPVVSTMMVEPTESESKAELDRFCDAMLAIYSEIKQVESGSFDKLNNPLKNAPHTAEVVVSDTWDRPYSRELAAFPNSASRERKFWPAVGRIDGTYGDRNLFCTCGE